MVGQSEKMINFIYKKKISNHIKLQFHSKPRIHHSSQLGKHASPIPKKPYPDGPACRR